MRTLAQLLVVAALGVLTAPSGEAQGLDDIEAARRDYARGMQFLRDAASATDAETACSRLRSAESVFRNVAIDLRRIRNGTPSRDVMVIADDVANDAEQLRDQAQRAQLSCTPKRTTEQAAADGAQAAKNARYFYDLFAKDKLQTSLGKAILRSDQDDPAMLRQFIEFADLTSERREIVERLAKALAARASRMRTVAAPAPVGVARVPKMPARGQTFRECGSCPEMVVLPADSLITYRLAIGVTEVTRAEWRACADDGACDSSHVAPDPLKTGDGEHPVSGMTFFDAETYARWLSRRTGREYGVPSRTEWKLGARDPSGQPSRTTGNFENFGDKITRDLYLLTSPVRFFGVEPNGTYDMAGNVAEWTRDCWDDKSVGHPTDGSAWRGERWNSLFGCPYQQLEGASFANLDDRAIPRGAPYIGFRVVRRDSVTASDRAAAADSARAAQAAAVIAARLGRVQAQQARMGRPLPRGVLTTLPLPTSCVVERVPWFGGTTALHWVPESLRGIEAAGGGTAPGISSKGVIIDGAATYSELLVMDSIPRLVHVRLTTDRPTLVGICLAPGDLLPAREVLESVRWKGESTAGVRGASLPALGNAAPRRDAPVRRVLDRSVVSDMIRLIPTGNGQRRDDRAAYERFEEHGVTLTLPDGDWVVDLTNEGVRVRHLVGVAFAASCLVSVGREWNVNDFHSNRKVDTTSLTGDQYTEIGGRYTRWRTTSNGSTELERYAGRKPILRATCSLGGDPLYPVGRQLRGIAFSLRWGDEPETP